MKMNAFTQWNLQVLLFVIPEYLSPQSLKVKGLHNHTSKSQMSRLRHSECSYNNFSKVTHYWLSWKQEGDNPDAFNSWFQAGDFLRF